MLGKRFGRSGRNLGAALGEASHALAALGSPGHLRKLWQFLALRGLLRGLGSNYCNISELKPESSITVSILRGF